MDRRVVLISGASSGLGRACAERLDSDGWTVVAASRRGTAPGHASGLVMDVDDDRSVADGVAAVRRDHGRIDALVVSAGWGVAGPAELTSMAEAKAQFETNFWGAVRAVQAVLPAMRATGRGRIVLVSSIGGVIGIPFQSFYSASKFALEGFGEALAYEVAPFGIDVTLVEPGNFRTEFTDRRRMAGADGPAKDGPAKDGPAKDGPAPYEPALTRAVSLMERDERNGADPVAVADVVAAMLDRARPPRRVSVGKAGERVGLLAKRVLPFRAFAAAAKGSLGV